MLNIVDNRTELNQKFGEAIAEIMNEQVAEAGEPLPADQDSASSGENTAGIEDAVLVKKPMFTMRIGQRSKLIPNSVLFAGIGNMAVRYNAWLRKRYKDALEQLGNQTKNGKIRPAYMDALGFIDLLIKLHISTENFEDFCIVYEGPRLPRQIDFTTPVKALVLENCQILDTLKGMYSSSK